jgi:two-component system cell cycle sensor histidine kinase/response regulator CckA
VRIPLFVTASGILLVIALGFAFALARLSAAYHRRYVREWQFTWVALALYALTAGVALVAVNVPALTPWRPAFSLISLLAAWWHLRSLGVGMRDLCAPGELLPAWKEWVLGALLLSAVALIVVPVEPRSTAAFQLYLGRISLVAVAWGVAYGAAGWTILRRHSEATPLARGTLGWSLVAYGVLRLLEPLSHLLGPSPILAQVLTFGGLPLLVGMGGGMLITLLEVERTRALRESDARTSAERTATASEAALATALASSADPVLIVDPDGRIKSGNARFVELVRQITGIDVRIGGAIEALMDEPTRAFWKEAFPRAVAGEAIVRRQPFRVIPGEAPRLYAVRLSPVRESGRIIGVLVVAHDATEEERLRDAMVRREAWFRLMIENASDIIFQVSPDGSIEYASPSLERLLGRPPESITGHSGFDFVHPEDVPPLRDAMLRSFARDDTVPSTVPFRARRDDGEYVQLEAVSRPYTERDGSPHLIVVARDVRERLRLEGELLSARRLESVGRLAGGVAHDFNNLLTAVVGNVSLLRERAATDPGVLAHLGEIEHAVQRGAELTRRLLAFARRQLIEPRLLNLGVQVRDLEQLLRRLLGDAIVLETAVPAQLWTIRADPTSLEQVLVNLAVNARDAMPQGGTLRIAASNISVSDSGLEDLNIPQGDWVRVDVSDTGVGIEEGLLGHIFEPFFTTKERSGGTGLGLATVYGAMTQAGGHVRVRSVRGQGTTFSLFFARVVATPAPARTSAHTGIPRAADGEVVLLVEDEAGVRDVTAKLLRRLGYEVLSAEDGERAIAVVAAGPQRLDLVISDLMMPGINGVETVRRIQALRPGVPAFFISGFSEEALRGREGMPSEGRLLAKPFTVEELGLAAAEALGR